MAYEILPVEPDDTWEPVGPAPPAATAPPEVGPKNIYKNRDKYELPSITREDLPEIVLPGAPAGAQQPAAPQIMPVDPDDNFIAPSEAYDPKSDFAFTRGTKVAFTGMGQSLLTTAEMGRIATLPKEEARQALLELRQQKTDPRNAKLSEPSFTDVSSLGEAATFVGESAGQIVGSLLGAGAYGGAPGAVVGGAAGSVLPGAGTLAGAATGATVGTLGAFLGSGPGASLEAALQDDAIGKALEDGTLDPHALLGITGSAGALVGAIDAIPAGKWIMQLGGKQISQEGFKVLVSQAVKRGLVKGAALEGGTEGLQQAIDETTQALTGGDMKLAERGLNVINAALVGAIGGAPAGAAAETTENARIELLPGAPLVGGAEGPTQPVAGARPPVPGAPLPAGVGPTRPEEDKTQATTVTQPGVVATDAAGVNTPGNLGAGSPAQPAGAKNTVQTPTTVVTAQDDIDPAVRVAVGGHEGAGPEALPTDQPDVTEGAIPEDELPPEATDEQAAALARVTGELLDRQRAEDAAREQEKLAATPVVETGEIASDVAAALGQQAKKNRSKRTPKVKTPVVKTPVVQAAAPAVETVDTGDNVVATAPVAETPAATAITEEAAGVLPAAAAVEQQGEPLDKPLPDVLGTPAPQPIPETSATGGTSTATEAVATPEPVEPSPVPAAPLPSQREVDTAIAAGQPIPGAKAEVVKEVSAERSKPEAQADARVEAVEAKKLTVVQQRAREAELARAKAPAAEKAKEVSAERGKLTIERKEPLTIKRRGVKVVEAPKPTTGREEAAEAPEAQPTTPNAPAEPTEAEKAKPTEVSREAADRADKTPTLRRSTVSELTEYRSTLDDVAAEVIARRRKENPGAPMSDTVRDSVDEIAETVKQRLAEAQKEFDERSIAAEDAVATRKTAAKAEAAKEVSVKRAEQAKATQGSKKERASPKKKMSAEGIRTQSDESVLTQEEKELKKLPKLRDQLVMQHAQLVREKLKKETTPERKTQIAELEQAIREQRIAAAEAAREEGPGLSEEHKEVEAKLEEATKDVPRPELEGSVAVQPAVLNAHLAAFLEAIKGIKIAGRHDRKANSPLENLAIFAHKLREKNQDVDGKGPLEFWIAHGFVEDGSPAALEQLTATVTNEKIKGAELREETTGQEGVYGDVTERLEEGESVERVRRQGEEERAAPSPDDLARGRGGREGAVTRHMAEGERAERSVKSGTVVTQAAGQNVTIQADTASATQRLRELDPNELSPTGFFSFFRNMHIRMLKQLVGDIPVHIISSEDMRRIAGGDSLGLYRSYSDRDTARGVKPAVFITEEAAAGLANLSYSTVLVHELTHAATAKAYKENVRGSRVIIDKLRAAMLKDLRDQGFSDQDLRDEGIAYGLLQANEMTAGLEFIAEAFSNPKFQKFMSMMVVPRSLRMDIAAMNSGRPLSWWQAFTSAVSNAIGMVRGQRGNTYMEQVVALYPDLTRSSVWQQTKAKENYAKAVAAGQVDGTALPRALARGPADMHLMQAEFQQRVEGVRDWAASGWPTLSKQKLVNTFSTLGQMQRRSIEQFGGVNNPFIKLSDFLLKKEPLRDKYRAVGQRLEVALLAFEQQQPAMYRSLSDVLHEASRWHVDPTVPLSHENNGHIPKTGLRGSARRKAHERYATAWRALSPEAQGFGRELADHYREQHQLETEKLVRHSVRSALDKHRVAEKLAAAGKTEEQAVQWVLSKAAARKAEERDADDKAFHDALGEAAKTLAGITEPRRLKGLYVPLARRGRWFITAIEKIATPDGAALDPNSKDGNRFLFTDKNKALDYAETSELMPHVSSYWVDPKTRQRTLKTDSKVDPATGQLVDPVEIFVVQVQNKHLIMHDSKAALRAHTKELRDAGHQVSTIARTGLDFERQAIDLSPRAMQALINNVAQTTVGSTTIGQQGVRNAVIEAGIRAATRPSALTRRLKRKGTMGFDTDLSAALREYNKSSASHFANLDLAHDMAHAEDELNKFMNDRRRTETGSRFHELQLMQAELQERFKSNSAPSERGGVSRIVDAMMNTSFLRHLFSPHYTIIQMLQPFMTTYPVLASQYGDGAAWSAIIAAYRIGGVKKTLGTGMHESWSALRNINPYSQARVTEAELEGVSLHTKMWLEMTANEADAVELKPVLLGLDERGWGSASGIEAGALSEQDLTKGEIGLQRLTNVAKGLPESAEGVNRSVTGIAAYRLARQAGDSIEVAQRKAWLAVEQTQGGYAAANNPRMFQHKLARLPLQFKKYGVMYAQMYYGSVAKLVATDPETRKVARKQLVRLSATTMAFAGVGGLPLVELARIIANVAFMLGLSDDDWEDWENGIQEWFASFMGEGASEAVIHGATRVVGVDTSAALGADNLITFGQPKNMDEEGTMAWMFKAAVLGASGGMMWDMGKNIINADGPVDVARALPWPKLMKNVDDAIKLYSEGTTSKITGEQYAPPVNVGEAFTKSLGFQPASSARQFETKGGGRAQAEENQLYRRRNALFDKWNRARNRDGAAAASRVFAEDIKAWNSVNKDKKLRIDYSDLMRSKKQHEQDRRERQRALQ